jgi:SAM-dependent methyltransferase
MMGEPSEWWSDTGVDIERSRRERDAYDEHGLDEAVTAWHGRFPNVFESPNTRRAEERFDGLTAALIAGRRVYDMGCGKGRSSVRLLEMGAAQVLGLDISEASLAIARERADAQPYLRDGRLEFRLGDVTARPEGSFGCVFGRSILHHIDYRAVLPRLYDEHLEPGGAMLFMEPQGENLLIRLYARLVGAAHTPDERSFIREDLRWLRERFANLELHPVNYLTLPAGIVTSLLRLPADVAPLRACDRADEWIARRLPRLRPHFRQTIVVIRKPGAPAS